jgi:hypothetical protein
MTYPIDPVSGLPIVPIDPVTGVPVGSTPVTPVDTVTGLPVDPYEGMGARPMQTGPVPLFSGDPNPDVPDTPGAVNVDVAALIRRIQLLEANQAAILANQPKPVSMVATTVQNLGAHVEARGNQSPGINFTELRGVLGVLEKKIGEGVALAETDASRVKLAIENLAPGFHQFELHYLPQLASSLHKAILDDLENLPAKA